MAERELTPKQRRFVQEYLVDLNAFQAAIRAGYSDGSYAYQLLRKPHVHRVITEAFEHRAEEIELDQLYVLRGLMETVERCMQRKPVMEWDPDAKAMVHKLDAEGREVWEFEPFAAIKALELLGKHQGMFATKVQVEGLLAVLQVIAELPASEAQRLLELPDRELRDEVRRLSAPR
jgi:phage terminase small subunit